ncbi:2-amino-4-oxopentanoate thiolase subunit OrtA [Clostridiaceae bacterium HFYG-1003]|nr:2-amino-4-oxopentanoate thiolase subunit OrtA [Clostridiaceae bacterium HFYG-1003]
MTAKKGDWVRIHSVILTAAQRTGSLPEDTRVTDIQMWTKGFLLDEAAALGDEVTVETYIGRHQSGTLTQIEPFYDHNYGKCVPELLYIGRSLRADLKEYEAQRKEEGQDER